MPAFTLTKRFIPHLALLALFFAAMTTQTGCSSEQSDEKAKATQPVATSQHDKPRLRAITLRQLDGPGFLPRSGLPESAELELLDAYAENAGKSLEWILVDSLGELFSALEQGRGELAAANLTITESRLEQVAFSAPITFVREVVIGRKGDQLESVRDLAGRRIAVHGESSFQETLEKIYRQRYQEPFEIVTAGASSDDLLLDGIAEGAHDLVVLDSNTAQALLPGREDLQIVLTLPDVRPVAWAVRPDNQILLTSLNRYLSEHQLLDKTEEGHTGDLDSIKARGVLRMATRNNAANYFLLRGDLMGFEYELVKHFADKHRLRLEVVVPPNHEALADWVREGRADLAAASLTIPDGPPPDGMVYSRPYQQVSELLVSRTDGPAIQSLADLADRTIVVRRHSSYWRTLTALQEQGHAFTLQAAPEHLETEQIIERVALGEYDLTVADSHIVDIEQTYRTEIHSPLTLGDSSTHGWMMRAGNPQLSQAVDSFWQKEYRGLFYNITRTKYFGNTKRILTHVEQRVDSASGGALSPYDEMVRQYAERYGFDWRLILSQMYQESRFDPTAKSWAGALGLMQVLPRTGKELGLSDLHDPETGIHAGIKYMDWLMRRFEPELNMAERTWFALAAYNAGIGHVRDARRLAAQKGWETDQWFDNVEKAMLLLSQPDYHRKAAHGYVRGREPVNYVRHIRDRFEAYARLTDP